MIHLPTFMPATHAPLTNLSALNFDGVDDYVDIGTGVAGAINGAGMSFSAWFKRGASGARHVITDLNVETGKTKFQAEIQAADTIRVGARSINTDSYQSVTTTGTWTDTDWHHLFAVVDIANDTISLWVDGSSAATTGTPSWTNTVFAGTSGYNDRIGDNSASSGPFNGKIDMLGYYDAVLGASNATAAYNAGVPVDLRLIANSSDLIAFLPFEENTGTTTYDLIGSNDGTLENGTAWTTRT